MRYLIMAAVLLVTACARDETIYSYGGAGPGWQVDTLNGAPFAATATLTFDANGGVRGFAPCNTFRTKQTVPYPWIAFDPIIATKRACPDLDQETALFRVLEKVTLGIIRDDILTLSNDDGDAVTLSRVAVTAD